jgi:hypothetical protein
LYAVTSLLQSRYLSLACSRCPDAYTIGILIHPLHCAQPPTPPGRYRARLTWSRLYTVSSLDTVVRRNARFRQLLYSERHHEQRTKALSASGTIRERRSASVRRLAPQSVFVCTERRRYHVQALKLPRGTHPSHQCQTHPRCSGRVLGLGIVPSWAR